MPVVPKTCLSYYFHAMTSDDSGNVLVTYNEATVWCKRWPTSLNRSNTDVSHFWAQCCRAFYKSVKRLPIGVREKVRGAPSQIKVDSWVGRAPLAFTLAQECVTHLVPPPGR
jgi:hypothetical protein